MAKGKEGLELKKEILLALGKTPIIEDEKLFIEPNDWFVPIKNGYPALEKEYARLELNKNPVTTAQTEALSSVRTHWLRNPSINLTDAFNCTCPEYHRRTCGELCRTIIKAFQNPICLH